MNGRAIPFLRSAFGHDGRLTLASVADGLSTTAFVAEIAQGSDNDIRGTVWTTTPGGGSYMTRRQLNAKLLAARRGEGSPTILPSNL